MAPQLPTPSTLVFDCRTQIISNCKFLINKSDTVEVVTSKDPTSTLFKALAVQCSEESGEILLESNHCKDAQKAVESLHTKSCEAIYKYAAMNGFAKPRDLKLAFLEPNLVHDDDDNDDDDASIISSRSESSTAAISDWGSSGDEAMMLKHTSRTSAASKDRQRPCGPPGQCITTTNGAHELVGDTRPRKACRDDAFEPAPPCGRVARPAHSRSPSFGLRQGPPPPPPPGHSGTAGPSAPPPSMRNVPMPLPSHPYSAGMGVGPHPSRPQNNTNPSMPPPQYFPSIRAPGFPVDPPSFPTPVAPIRPGKPPGHSAINNYHSSNGNSYGNHLPRPLSVFHPQVRTHTVRITVHWLRHGQHRIIAQCQPTRESLQSAAVTDVRMNPDVFTGDKNSNPTISNSGSSSRRDGASNSNRDTNAMTLRAHVRQAVFDGEPYDMRAFHGQDLARLFHVMAADDSIPSFEVIVEEVPHDADDANDSSSDDDGASERRPLRGGRWD